MIEIYTASEQDILRIEDILLDTTRWPNATDKLLWCENEVRWERLKKDYSISDFVIALLDDIPAACMAVTDHDPFAWPGIAKGHSLFIHKLAVKRFAAGKGVSDALILHAKRMCVEKGIAAVRLDCDAPLPKLRAVYERNGFVCIEEKNLRDYAAALYEWQNNSHGSR